MLPMTTRTVTIESPNVTGDDPMDQQETWTTTETAAPAHIGDAVKTAFSPGQEQVDVVLFLNPDANVSRLSRVTDNTTGEVYGARWKQRYVGVGLDHIKVGMVRITGANA